MPLTNPSSNSSAYLAADPQFQSRVKELLAAYCNVVYNEAVSAATINLHNKRAQQAEQIIANINGDNAPNWPRLFADLVAADTTVISDATAGLTVDVNATNAAASALLVTDTHINNAIAANFNVFLSPV